MLDRLQKNEYLPEQTFDTFLAKKLQKGKRTLFLNKDTNASGFDNQEMAKQYL